MSSAALRPDGHAGSLQNPQDCRASQSEPLRDLPTGLSELVCLDNLGPQP
jgi:hypothetical protein